MREHAFASPDLPRFPSQYSNLPRGRGKAELRLKGNNRPLFKVAAIILLLTTALWLGLTINTWYRNSIAFQALQNKVKPGMSVEEVRKILSGHGLLPADDEGPRNMKIVRRVGVANDLVANVVFDTTGTVLALEIFDNGVIGPGF